MSEPYVHPRQPDYGSWPSDPDNPIFEDKKALLDRAYHNWTYGTMTEKDFVYLHAKATQFWQLMHFFANYRVELETEIFAKDLEIDNLKQQLKEKDG